MEITKYSLMKVFNSTYTQDQKRMICFLSLLLIFNLNVIPVADNISSLSNHPRQEIVSADMGYAVLVDLMLKSKKPSRSVNPFMKINLFQNSNCAGSVNKSNRINTLRIALNIHDIKMDESFLLTHYSTDI